MNILIAEPLAPAGIELFRSQPGWNTIVSNPKEYAQYLPEAFPLTDPRKADIKLGQILAMTSGMYESAGNPGIVKIGRAHV